MINTKIFKKYDIRGIYPTEINERIVEEIANALVIFINKKYNIKKPRISVGRDGRTSSKSLYESLISSLVRSGVDVKALGIVTTPLTYFSSLRGYSDFSVMITASHNPKEYNGLKIAKGALLIFKENGLKDIEELYIKNKKIKGIGNINVIDIIKDYKKYLKDKIRLKNKLKIVVDAGNGVAGFVFKEIAEVLNIKYVPLFFEIDGNFPNHEANPIKEETLDELKKKVIEENADLGIAFDGDGDRIGIVDEKGRFIRIDEVVSFLIDNLGKKGKNIYVDLRISKIVDEIAKSKECNLYRLPVGNPYYKIRLNEDKHSLLGAELSGHIMFKEHFCIDDAIFAALKLIELLEKQDKKPSEIFEKYRVYAKSPEINFNVKDKETVLKVILDKFKDKEIETIDGITVKDKDWWFNVRKSNTEPLIRLNAEANDEETLNKIIKEVKEVILKSQ